MRVLRVHLFLSEQQCVTTVFAKVCNIFTDFSFP